MDLKLYTYNIKGFKPRNFDFVLKIFKDSDILLIQETWLYNYEINIIQQILPEANIFMKSSMSEEDIDRYGKPFGGCAVAIRNSLNFNTVAVDTISNRLLILRMTNDRGKYLICNVYMPVNDGSVTSYEEFGDILSEMSSIMAIYDDYQPIIGGDFNVDFKTHSFNLTLLKNFIEDEGLFLGNSFSNNPNSFTFESAMGNRSYIDHFLLSSNFVDRVSKCSIVIDGSNLSDHNPLNINLKCDDVDLTDDSHKSSNDSNNLSGFRVDWSKASEDNIEHYKFILDSLLDPIMDELVTFNNFECNQHSDSIFKCFDRIINAMNDAAILAIPKIRTSCKKRGLPGWNEHVQPFRDKSILWTNISKEAGCPNQGHLYEIKKDCKKKYHAAIKHIKESKDYILKCKTAHLLNNKKFNCFWKQIQKMKNAKPNLPDRIDGKTGNENITECFKEKYKDLYNSVDDNELNDIKIDINNKLQYCVSGECKKLHKFTDINMKTAVSSLKKLKKDYIYGIYSNNIIFGSDKLHNVLLSIFNSILIHGCMNEIFNRSVIIPLIKDKRKPATSIDNYRAISLCSVLCKLFEYLIIDSIGTSLKSDNYQFAYKEEHSTTMCTSVALEVIQYYKSHSSNVFALFLDASKAFDNVVYSKLFNILLYKGICPLFIRMIINMYYYNNCKIKWKNTFSSSFFYEKWG